MFLALEAGAELDLAEYGRLLWQQKIAHQIGEQDGRQFVAVADHDDVARARELFQRWQAGQISPSEQDSSALTGYLDRGRLLGDLLGALQRYPLTLLLIALSGLLLLLAPLARPTALTQALRFPEFSYGDGFIILSRVWEQFSLTDLLRMLTPILLHGGLLHLLFNMSWLWELGRRIERQQSTLTLALVILLIALFSNSIQYLWGGSTNFGGMSGVIYGLFAYIWLWQLVDPRQGLALQKSLILFMLASLALFTYLDLGMIANAAHLGGFFTGLLIGALTALVSRIRRAARQRTR
ncbi:MAG: rhomboid family intramembrane serine protease [Pseudohongiellaceae bacterium]